MYVSLDCIENNIVNALNRFLDRVREKLCQLYFKTTYVWFPRGFSICWSISFDQNGYITEFYAFEKKKLYIYLYVTYTYGHLPVKSRIIIIGRRRGVYLSYRDLQLYCSQPVIGLLGEYLYFVPSWYSSSA